MTETWCIVGNSNGAGERLAEDLLNEGHHVALIVRDAAPFAMIVNRYADSVFVFEVNSVNRQFLSHAVDTLDEYFGGVDTIAILPAGGFAAETAQVAQVLAQYWPGAELRFMSDSTLTAA